jgi:hypothetical protein
MSTKEKELWAEIAKLNKMGHAAMRIRKYIVYATTMGILHPNGDFKVALGDFDQAASECEYVKDCES